MKKSILSILALSLMVEASEPIKIKWGSDFRFRNEIQKKEGVDGQRYRQRIKAKLGFTSMPSDWAKGGIEFSTGIHDPVSTNLTLGKDATTENFGLNLAYASLYCDHVEFTVGKFKNTLQTPVKSELVWDGDLNPEGLALSLEHGEDSKVELNNQMFWLREDAEKKDDITWVESHQVVFTQKAGSHKIQVLGAYHDYHNIQNRPALAGEDAGNTVDEEKNYAFDYNMLDLGLVFATKVADIPLELGGGYVQNLEADDLNKGFEAAVKINKAKEAGSWQAKFTYRKVEADATISAFSDSDFNGGNTQAEGFEVNARYKFTKELYMDATQFVNSTIDKDESGRYTTQLDLNYKF